MPKGPRGEKRPADVIGAAVKVMKIVRLGAIQAALDRGWGKPAQAVAITGDPDSPVIFHLAMGDGLVPKVIDGEVVASEPLGKPLVAFSGSDDADSPV